MCECENMCAYTLPIYDVNKSTRPPVGNGGSCQLLKMEKCCFNLYHLSVSFVKVIWLNGKHTIYTYIWRKQNNLQRQNSDTEGLLVNRPQWHCLSAYFTAAIHTPSIMSSSYFRIGVMPALKIVCIVSGSNPGHFRGERVTGWSPRLSVEKNKKSLLISVIDVCVCVCMCLCICVFVCVCVCVCGMCMRERGAGGVINLLPVL